MTKFPRTNVIDRHVAAAIAKANPGAEVTGDDLAMVMGGRGIDNIATYGAPRPRKDDKSFWERIRDFATKK